MASAWTDSVSISLRYIQSDKDSEIRTKRAGRRSVVATGSYTPCRMVANNVEKCSDVVAAAASLGVARGQPRRACTGLG